MYIGLTEANDSFCLLKTTVCEKFPLPSTINKVIAYSIPAWMQVLQKETIHCACKDLCMWEISTAFVNKQYDCLQHSCMFGIEYQFWKSWPESVYSFERHWNFVSIKVEELCLYSLLLEIYIVKKYISSVARAVMLNNCFKKVGKCRKDINIIIDIKVSVSSFSLISLLRGRGLDRSSRWGVGLGWTNW